MKDAQIFTRRNGHMSASCDGVADTGYEVTENGRGLYTVYSVDDPDQTIAVDVSREEAEKAITEDWRKPRT